MRKVIASCSVILLAGIALAACGGSSGSAKAGATNPPSGASGASGGATGSSGSDDLSALYGEAANAKFKITFTDNDGTATTFAQDGNGNSMYKSGDSQFFTSSSGSVSCSNINTTPKCIKTSIGTSVNPFLGIFNAGKTYIQALGKYGDTSSKTIAGRDATCVEFSKDSVASAGPVAAAVASAIKGSLTYCIDKKTGVLLSFATVDADGKTTDSFTVTEYGEPSDSDFTPPATPESISIPSISLPSVSLPAGVTIPGNG
jgi:hypothetical protein